jgi:hypothetical protein
LAKAFDKEVYEICYDSDFEENYVIVALYNYPYILYVDACCKIVENRYVWRQAK